MFSVELYGRVRHACHVEGLSLREAARRFGIHRNTVRKMLAFAVPPGYRRRDPPARPRLGAFTAVIDRILEEDRSAPAKQRHTAKRIHERLRAEHGFAGGYTIVRDYVRERRAGVREVFVPLAHPPGHAQADFGEAVAVVGGGERKGHFFRLDLPHSDACFVKAYPAERLEAFCDGHNAAFAFFGGVPRSILYDNTRLAVARIRGDGTRERTRGFAELWSHYLFLDRFGRPGKGNDKGKVEGLVGYARRNFLVPVPRVESFAALNAHLERRCLDRLDHRVRGHAESIGERLERDLAALQARPAAPYEACERKAARVSAMLLGRFDPNDYSVPTAYGHRAVLVRGHVDEVVIACGAETIARHPRSYAREDFVFDPLHYLALLERKGVAGKREYVQVLRLLEAFPPEEVHAAVREALRLGAIGFDAVKHLLLCRIERRPPRLDLEAYPCLPRVAVAATSAKACMALLGGTGP